MAPRGLIEQIDCFDCLFLSIMNLRDLAYFVALADARHFGQAAEASHVSQPTLSGQIRKLEATLGVALFERDSRNVALTAAGEAVLVEARAVLRHAAAVKEVAGTFRDPLAGTFRLGVIASLAPFHAADLLGQLQRDAPRLEVVLSEGVTEDLLAQLRAGMLDAAIIATAAGDDRLQEFALFDEPFLIGHAPDHPLSDVTPLSVGDIERGTLLLLGEGHCLRDQALGLCGAASVDARVKSTSLSTLMRLAAAGQGVTLVPALAASAAGGLTLRPIEKRGAMRRVRLVARRNFPRAGALQVVAAASRAAAVSGLALADDVASATSRGRRRRRPRTSRS